MRISDWSSDVCSSDLAAGCGQVDVVREFEAAIVHRPAAERCAGEAGMLARPRLHQSGKLRMAGAEIGGIAQLRVLQSILQSAVAIGAEGLRCGLHRTGALMFAVAIDAGAFGRDRKRPRTNYRS